MPEKRPKPPHIDGRLQRKESGEGIKPKNTRAVGGVGDLCGGQRHLDDGERDYRSGMALEPNIFGCMLEESGETGTLVARRGAVQDVGGSSADDTENDYPMASYRARHPARCVFAPAYEHLECTVLNAKKPLKKVRGDFVQKTVPG